MKRFLSSFLLFLAIFSLFGDEVSKKETNCDVLLMIALPGSGKSEVRTFLNSQDPKACYQDFKIRPTVQIDDFPYVFLMRRISEELTKRGYDGMFFLAPNIVFKNVKEWGTLIHLLNEDFNDLISKRELNIENSALWMFERLDRAREKAGVPKEFVKMDKSLKSQIAAAVENEAKKIAAEKKELIAAGCEGKTVVIEFSRGGAHGSTFPLPSPYGYKYALSLLDEQILNKSSIFYIWVTPEESRRKNEKRKDPNDPGSVLGHSVPLAVMYTEYGCDDIFYLKGISDRKDHLKIEKNGHIYYVPIRIFDNRHDKTSFVREKVWGKEDKAVLYEGLKTAFHESEMKVVN